jgi:hypothetical protein
MRAHDIQTVTEFARNPNRALKKIEQGDIILRRTNCKGSIRVSLESRDQAASTGMGEMARVLALFIQTLPSTSGTHRRLATHYPWVRFLPERDRAEFVREILETMKACASINSFSPIEAVVNAWRSSAEIHADPELLAQLTKRLSVAIRPALLRP